ncbi:MAG: hypothetical protein FVQ81_17675 [Candidatus Glassbacteria bacterium]|nr:hypothetical protein [Candidatus Glassbacteria bacterium]
MKYRLALDLGTASVCLGAVELDGAGREKRVVYHKIKIFQEPLLVSKKGGVGATKKSGKRLARQQRRQIERRSRRYRKIAHLAPLLHLDPSKIPPDSGQRIHSLRADAATSPISLSDLLRVFLKMAKRRGYAGGFRVKAEKDKGVVETGIYDLESKMAETDSKTLGQYLNARFKKGETLRLKQAGLYAHRTLVEKEFEKIWNVQAEHHQILNHQHDGTPLKNIFFDAIFSQRPLRSPAAMVGQCPLEPTLPRAPRAQMAAQAFRIEKQIADLRWGHGHGTLPLEDSEREIIREMLHGAKEVSFEKIYKALKASPDCPERGRLKLNLEYQGREKLKGNTTVAAFAAKKLNLKKEWLTLDEMVQVQVINFLADLGSPDLVDLPGWAESFLTANGKPRVFHPQTVKFIDRMVDAGGFDRLSKMGFEGGRQAYSLKAIERLLEKMRAGMDEYDAVEAIYGHKEARELQEKLPPAGPAGNAVVDVALAEVRREVNRAIDFLGGPPAEIIVEMVREMGLGPKARNDIAIRIAKNQKERVNAAREIENHDEAATGTNILRYRLFEEQDRLWCPYCSDPIDLAGALDGHRTNIDHILPRSLTRTGRKRDQLVLAHRACNDAKLDATPFSVWGNDPGRWKIIQARAKRYEEKKLFAKAKCLLIEDYTPEVLDEEGILGFTERQFHESAWIAKKAAQWLRVICPDVAVTRGALTAHLRRIWKLDTVIPQVRLEEGLPIFDTDNRPISPEDFRRLKPHWESPPHAWPRQELQRVIEKRIDHRHHLVDALVIALSTRGLFQKMACHYKALAERKSQGERVRMALYVPPPLGNLRELALEAVRNPNLSHKPDRYPDIRFFKDNPHGAVQTEKGEMLLQKSKLSEIAGKRDSDATVLKRIGCIAAPVTREAVREAYRSRRAEGLEPHEALAAPIMHLVNKTEIVNVRLLGYGSHTAKRIEHVGRGGAHHKYLSVDGYAYLELAFKDGKPQLPPRAVPAHEAMASKGQPAPGHVRRFWKNDTVIDESDGKRYLVRQIVAQGGTLFLTPYTDAREVRDMKKADGLRKVSGKGLARLRVTDE